MENIRVTKRDGSKELINLDKIHQVLDWAVEGLDNVSISQIEMKSSIQFYDGITTDDIHETLVKTAADLISESTPNYQYVASRLALFRIRKVVYGGIQPTKLYKHIRQLTKKGLYDKHILEDYTKSEIDNLCNYINHERDMNFAYAGFKQLEGKYLLQNRTTGEVFETPQMLYMLVAMCLFSKYKDNRLDYVKRYYDAASTFKISLPTPIMAGVRTPTRQFSSCVVIDCDDSLDSINATSSAIVRYVSKRAGIGINAGRIRAVGSDIRQGLASHTGLTPFLKLFQASVKSCSQGGLRGGAATTHYPLWHLEVESLLVLKNNRGVEDNRVRHMDYSVQINKTLYNRLIKGQSITLFSPSDVEGLYDAFFEDQELFEKLYTKYEKDPSIRKSELKATELFSMLMQERASTGRIYVQNVDHCNTHGSFIESVAPIRMSNLCVAPETKILTREGYEVIGDLEGQEVDVWNGQEWSTTTVVKTGTNQKLIKVSTNFNQEIECTPYHKFYVQVGSPRRGGSIVVKQAQDLKQGDKLIKFELPIIEGTEVFNSAYTNGFYSGDGCFYRGKGFVYLYHDKQKLLDRMQNVKKVHTDEKQNRQTVYFKEGTLKDKYFVPLDNYTIKSRLEWLAGICDSDGTVSRNGTNESIQISSTQLTFLQEIQLMLQTLGVTSTINEACEEGWKDMPLNDGSGETSKFFCQKAYRLLINSNSLFNLSELGFETNRLQWNKRKPHRECNRFMTIKSVEDLGRVDDTYCFTEHKRNMGMFNGILTGQCQEILIPTKPLNDVNDENGEIGLCTLAAINLGEITDLNKDMDNLCDLVVRSLDALLDYQDYPVKAAEISTLNRRMLGVGVINFAYYLAKNGLKYSDGSANDLTHETFESLQYHLLKASNNLAKEMGACDYFNETKYSQGLLPIDTYKESVDGLVSTSLKLDWESLREDTSKYGLRNSTLSAQMPSETSSQVSNSTNGIESPRGLMSIKSSKDGILKQVVPEIDNPEVVYETLWTIPNNKGYLELVAIMQKFIVQGISTNTNYDPSKFDGGKVPMKVLLQDLLTAYKLGVKTLYYHQTRDGADDTQNDVGADCESGACAI